MWAKVEAGVKAAGVKTVFPREPVSAPAPICPLCELSANHAQWKPTHIIYIMRNKDSKLPPNLGLPVCLPQTYQLDSGPAARSFSQRWWYLALPRVGCCPAPHPRAFSVLAWIIWAEPQRYHLKGILISTWPRQFITHVTKRPVNVTSLFGESIPFWKWDLEVWERPSSKNTMFSPK